MRFRAWFLVLGGCAVLAGSIGCSEFLYERQDKSNVRRQFHLPREATFVTYDASPKSGGFFGREGLTISVAVQFTDALFERYVAELDDPETWKGVPFLGYSPDRAEIYSDAALRWTAVPEPDLAGDRYRYWKLRGDALRVERGRYYCSTIVMARGEPLKANPAAYHWNHLGRACSEIGEQDTAVVRVVGVLDLDAKRLYARIGFSG